MGKVGTEQQACLLADLATDGGEDCSGHVWLFVRGMNTASSVGQSARLWALKRLN